MTNQELIDLCKKARDAIEAMTPAEREAMWEEQRQSWIRGEAELAIEERDITAILPVILSVAEFPYDRQASLDLRNAIIELRDEALKQGDFEWAVKLSHVVAWMAVAIEKLQPEVK